MAKTKSTMLKPEEIKELLNDGRNETFDWVAETADPKAMAGTMCAMANAQGGTILVGVGKKSSNIPGIQDQEAAIGRVLEAALMSHPPLIIPLPKTAIYDKAMLLVITVPQGMPHVYRIEGVHPIRRGAKNDILRTNSLRKLMLQRGQVDFEAEVPTGAGRGDLDWDKIEAYVDQLEGLGRATPEDVMLKRGCMVDNGRELRPTNAGLLLFGRDPQRWVRGSELTAARFAGATMGDTFTREDIVGTLPDQIRRAEAFLIDHMRKGVSLTGNMQREQQFEYPLEAAREIVVNAVAHRDYSIRGDGVRLFMFSNRMEIASPGGLPGPITLDNMQDERFSRNHIIIQVLADMGFVERMGYGIDRVIALMRENGLPRPSFEETAGGLRVTLYGPGEEMEVTKDTDLSKWEGLQLNPRQEAALEHLAKNTRITNSDLQELAPEVHPETIRRDLADLVKRGVVLRMGQKRGAYYILKKR
jgi:ATP-dependent DNA helicase RecG